METRNKNRLIIGLIAIVLLMSVAYAAFATQLQISSTSQITTRWDIHFDSANYVKSTDVTPAKTFAGGDMPDGDITYEQGNSPITATVHADLNQPGDSVIFRLRIINAGTLQATASTPTLSQSGSDFTINGLTALSSSKHIKFTVSAPQTDPLAPNGGTTIMTVKAEFLDYTAEVTDGNDNVIVEESYNSTGNMEAEQSAELTISLNYSQYVSG